MKALDFDKNFGLVSSVEEERRKFINRVEQEVFDDIFPKLEKDSWDKLYKHLCFALGERFEDVQKRYAYPSFNKMPIEHLTKHDFFKALKIIVSIGDFIDFEREDNGSFYEERIQNFLRLSSLDIGIRFAKGQFYPSGEKILDKELIDYSLECLLQYPEQNKHLKSALKHYASKELENTLQDCYLCMEGLTKIILKNNNRLDENKDNILRLLNFSSEWKRILVPYIEFIHQYGRHASEKQKSINDVEVEACLYQTYLLIRAIIRSLN
jgi:hypothetical protein